MMEVNGLLFVLAVREKCIRVYIPIFTALLFLPFISSLSFAIMIIPPGECNFLRVDSHQQNLLRLSRMSLTTLLLSMEENNKLEQRRVFSCCCFRCQSFSVSRRAVLELDGTEYHPRILSTPRDCCRTCCLVCKCSAATGDIYCCMRLLYKKYNSRQRLIHGHDTLGSCTPSHCCLSSLSLLSVHQNLESRNRFILSIWNYVYMTINDCKRPI